MGYFKKFQESEGCEMRAIKFILLIKLRKVIYMFFGSINGLFKMNKNILILCYHGISNDDWRYSVDVDVFERQLNYLVKYYSPITLEDVGFFIQGKKKIEKPSFVITIDDGYKDVLQLKDLFEKLNIRPTIFVLSDINNANRKELETNREFLSKDEILFLIEAGWTIGSHGATHPDFYRLSEEDIEKEIVSSKKNLEEELGIKIKYFAYPKGRYTNKVLDAVKKAGYSLGLSMNDSFINKTVNRLLIPRIGVDRTHSFVEFRSILLPLSILFRKFIKEKTGVLI